MKPTDEKQLETLDLEIMSLEHELEEKEDKKLLLAFKLERADERQRIKKELLKEINEIWKTYNYSPYETIREEIDGAFNKVFGGE